MLSHPLYYKHILGFKCERVVLGAGEKSFFFIQKLASMLKALEQNTILVHDFKKAKYTFGQ